jgi:glutaredoxin 3
MMKYIFLISLCVIVLINQNISLSKESIVFKDASDNINFDHLVKSNQVVLFTKKACTYCIKAKAWLKSNKILYHEIDIDDNSHYRLPLTKKTNYTMVPQIFIEGKFIGGFDNLVKIPKDTIHSLQEEEN